VECNGSELCIHRIRKELCMECGGHQICPHHLRKSRCAECGGTEVCIHGNNKYNCVECDNKHVCEHKRLQYQCTQCKGRRVCAHGVRKATCTTCTPSTACQHCKTVSILHSRWKPYCFRCYCVLHPDAIIPKMFKLKEHLVRDRLKEEFEESITMRFDKIVEGGCSNKRPDVAIDFGSHCLMIEIDENQHRNYECEQKRMHQLYEDVGCRMLVFLRFNPDGYQDGKTKYPSPFGYTQGGAVRIDKAEFERRMKELIVRIHAHRSEPTQPLTVEYLFYTT